MLYMCMLIIFMLIIILYILQIVFCMKLGFWEICVLVIVAM
jgi:hypothetical protein